MMNNFNGIFEFPEFVETRLPILCSVQNSLQLFSLKLNYIYSPFSNIAISARYTKSLRIEIDTIWSQIPNRTKELLPLKQPFPICYEYHNINFATLSICPPNSLRADNSQTNLHTIRRSTRSIASELLHSDQRVGKMSSTIVGLAEHYVDMRGAPKSHIYRVFDECTACAPTCLVRVCVCVWYVSCVCPICAHELHTNCTHKWCAYYCDRRLHFASGARARSFGAISYIVCNHNVIIHTCVSLMGGGGGCV